MLQVDLLARGASLVSSRSGRPRETKDFFESLLRYLRIELHFRHFIRFQTHTRARWVRKPWQYCFKIENLSEKMSTNLRYFSSLRGIILRLRGRIRKHVKNHEKEHSGYDWNNFFFYFHFTTFSIVYFYAFLQQFIAGETFKEARIFTTLLIKCVIGSTTARCSQCDSWPLSLICSPVICFINGGVDQYRCEKKPYQYRSNDEYPAIMNCETRSHHCLELLKNPCK